MDWQLWFASLRPYSKSSWINYLLISLLSQKDDVLRLLSDDNPVNFTPRYIRVLRYEYFFSNWTDFRKGFYWKRQFVNTYLEPISVSH